MSTNQTSAITSFKSLFKVFQSKLNNVDEISIAEFADHFFDEDFYRTKYRDLESVKGLDYLQHWLIHGQSELRSPHPLVDISFYRRFNSDVPVGDELRHYLSHGWKEGRTISPLIRSDIFREIHPDWVQTGVSPLEFLCIKLKNGEHISTGLINTELLTNVIGASPLQKLGNYILSGLGLPDPIGASVDDIDPLASLTFEDSPKINEPNHWVPLISVVIPIHSDHPITREMLDRISGATTNQDADIVLVLDGAEKSISTYASSFKRQGIQIVSHGQALGFSNAVNEGIKLAKQDRHILILNADVLARPQVFTLLYEALISDPSLGSVTAISNVGSTASYPIPGHEGRWLPEQPDVLSEAFESDGYQSLITQTSTCIGHCVLFRRSALEDVGYLDAQNFPEGYGEEVDWSIRASKKNWKHGIANRAFVWHQGSTSFKERKIKLLQRGESVLQRLHGADYEAVKRFTQDTISNLTFRFQHLDAHLVKSYRAPSKAVLTHSSGGGTFEFIDRELQDSASTVTLFFERDTPVFRVSLNDYFLPALGLTPIPLEKLSTILVALGVTEIEVHTGVTNDSKLFLLQIHKYSGEKRFFLHDYSPFCARINLVGGLSDSPTFCGAPSDDNTCQTCVNKHGSLVGAGSVRDLREVVRLTLAGANAIFVPHKKAGEIWEKWGIQTEVVRHNSNRDFWGTGITQKKLDAITLLDGSITKRVAIRTRASENRPKVLIPGRISYVKGAQLIREVLMLNRNYGSPLEFILCGEIDPKHIGDFTLFNAVLGDYESGLPSLAKEVEMEAVWLTSIWPETYLYVLDDLIDLPSKNILYLNSGMGAPTERSHGMGFRKVIEVEPSAVSIFQTMYKDLCKED
jgi:GT2 family glycosyltransferase